MNQRRKAAIAFILVTFMLFNNILPGFASQEATIVVQEIDFTDYLDDEDENVDNGFIDELGSDESETDNELPDIPDNEFPNDLDDLNGEELLLIVDSAIEYIDFPDQIFKNFVALKYGDGVGVTKDQAALVTELNVRGLDISDLRGIEFFTNLEELDCSYR